MLVVKGLAQVRVSRYNRFHILKQSYCFVHEDDFSSKNFFGKQLLELCLRPFQTSMMELSAKIVN